jgi:aspartyl-tRNA(Asn)/glutamyl-tRNA(Gln) amidotransferase subunit B
MEEDTGKLTHATVDGKEVSLIDFNRSGVPLVEIVTEPDIRSGEEARIFLTELQKIIRYVGVSDADMEKGHMRLEPNISLRLQGQKELAKYKVEVKNINSFKFVEKAIEYEEKRHKELLEKGETPVQETRGWNEFKNKTVSQRSKEEAHDYRYFPEPDIPPIEFAYDEVEKIKVSLPELPDKKVQRFISDYLLTDYNAEILTRDPTLADYFESAVRIGIEHNVGAVAIANYIINKKPDIDSLEPAGLVKQIVEQSTIVKMDENVLSETISKILSENEKAVEEYKSGKTQLLGFFIGQTKRALPDAKDTEQIRKKLLEMLE